MNTSSSGTCYHHPLVHVEQAELRMDYGWYAHVQHDCSSEALTITSVKLPRLSPTDEAQNLRKSLQAEFVIS